MKYGEFLTHKVIDGSFTGFDPVHMPDYLFDFQRALVDWSVRKGKAAIFADCGLGKTAMQLVWAENVARKTGKRVLILTPLAVAHQTAEEGEKFHADCAVSRDGQLPAQIIVTNYERLHYFNADDFAGVVCDESSILKNFDGARKTEITQFMRTRPYRLLCTATAAPNDYVELGTSSEALGELGHMDMLARFFKNTQNTCDTRNKWAGQDGNAGAMKWIFKGHAELPFWRWVCSWARACRKPSDLGFDDARFVLPDLDEREHIVEVKEAPEGMLFALPAQGLYEQRQERRRSITERCEMAADIALESGDPVVMWCHLNDEGDLLEELAGATQVSGSDSDESKEEKLIAFSKGQIKRLVTKPKIACFGMNWQHCNRMTFFPSHSFEQYYQSLRRCYRFGQTRPVRVDIIASEGEAGVLANMQRKAEAAKKMFENLVTEMNNARRIQRGKTFDQKEMVPAWL